MASQGSYGSFVPTTNIWDVSSLYSIDINSPTFKELLVRLYQNVNNITTVLNTKESGYYDNALVDFVDGNIWFPNPALNSTSSTTPTYRPEMRDVINFGALPAAAGTKSVPHGLFPNKAWSFTRIYATASDTTGLNYIPIPYASSVLANNIEINVDSTNVNITVGSNRSNFTITYVVLEYLSS